MLAKALAKCLASLDQDRGGYQNGSPVKLSPFPLPLSPEKQRGTLQELKAGVVVTKLSWRGPYERTLQLEDSSLVTRNPAEGRVTNSWSLTDVLAVRYRTMPALARRADSRRPDEGPQRVAHHRL